MPITGSFSSTQLTGSGITTASLGRATTFDFRNNGNSAYFVLEDTARSGSSVGGVFSASIGHLSGSFSTSQIPTLVTSSKYLMGAVVPSINSNFLGTGSVTFTPSDTTTSGSIRLRGVGNYTLIIT